MFQSAFTKEDRGGRKIMYRPGCEKAFEDPMRAGRTPNVICGSSRRRSDPRNIGGGEPQGGGQNVLVFVSCSIC